MSVIDIWDFGGRERILIQSSKSKIKKGFFSADLIFSAFMYT